MDQARYYSRFAFVFWLLTQLQFATSWLLFRNEPQFGTITRFVITGLFLYALLLSLAHRRRSPEMHPMPRHVRGSIGVAAFLTWAGLTLFWTPEVLAAAAYWANLTASVVIVALLARFGDTDRVVQSSIAGIFWGSFALSVIAICTTGYWSQGGQLGNAALLHPNVLGNQLALGALMGIHLVLCGRQSSRAWQIFCTCVLIVLLLLTLSKTAIVAFAAAAAVYVLTARLRIGQRAALAALAGAIIVFLYSTLQNAWVTYAALGDGRILETLSGRTVIWEMVQRDIHERPIMGHGLYSFLTEGPQPFEISIGSAHNELLNVWFNFGAVGLLLAIVLWVGLVKNALTYPAQGDLTRRSKKILSLALVAYFGVRGITEADPVALIFPLPLMLLLFEWLSVSQVRAKSQCSGHETKILGEGRQSWAEGR